MSSTWSWHHLLGAGLVLAGLVEARGVTLRKSASPSYRGHGLCPLSCSESGPDPTNWTAYHTLDNLQYCTETVHYMFNIHDQIDDTSSGHRIFACTANAATAAIQLAAVDKRAPDETLANVTYTANQLSDGTISTQDTLAQIDEIITKVLDLLSSGLGESDESNASPYVLFTQSLNSTAGLYMGRAVDAAKTGVAALKDFHHLLSGDSKSIDASSTTVSIQLCGPSHDAHHTMGFVASTGRHFKLAQSMLQSWSNRTCSPLSKKTVSFQSTATFRWPETSGNMTHQKLKGRRSVSHPPLLTARDDCSTVQVKSGDSCASLATACRISSDDFNKYNPSDDLCATLMPGQYVCCSSGSLPDLSPQPNANGTCATYAVVADDTCTSIGAANDVSVDDIDSFNGETWGWNGCNSLYVGANICLSKGDPPMPSALENAECGPQKPGTVIPDSGTRNISSLNPCPLNACCNIWGQCGITDDFCKDTNTGAPGTAKTGTNGCISNCGTDIIQGDGPSSFINLQYYEAFGMDRECLFQDISQLDLSTTTHIHYSFATLDSSWAVSVGETEYDEYEFKQFAKLEGVHKVLTIGGWAFSTDPDTYMILRDGVKEENREAMAKSIVSFITDNGLNGIDIDWEYPGEPDIPGIPSGDEDEPANYLEFLKVLKNLVPDGTTVSIAAPASYWYLKQFPIAEISEVVDYIVYMTYDLHGQWDYGSQWAQEGCTKGNCLRSHINLTETMTSLSMVTKAGVPTNKLIVGVSSYARSFAMDDAACHTPDCTFSGSSSNSDALPGACTNTSGYISDAELYDIIDGTNGQHLRRRDGKMDRSRRDRRDVSSRVSQYYVDQVSDSIIVVYDDNQWAAFMDDEIRSSRSARYAGLNLGGTTNWASDLETFNAAPNNYANWADFKLAIKEGVFAGAGSDKMNRTGNWTELDCNTPAVSDADHIVAVDRWMDLGCPDAFSQAIQAWKAQISANPGNANNHFSSTVADFFHLQQNADCGATTSTGSCSQTVTCTDGISGSGPAAYEIWNSFVFLHNLYYNYWSAIATVAAVEINPSLDLFMDTFAPIPPDHSQEVLDLILAFVGLGSTIGVSAVFNSVLKNLPYFVTSGGKIAYDNYKDTAKALVSFGVSVGGIYAKANSGKWTAESQDSFKAYMGSVMNDWQNTTSHILAELFSGSDESLELLQTVMGQGQFIAGGDPDTGILSAPGYTINDDDVELMKGNVTRSFYAFNIPSVWSAVGKNIFILDTKLGCSGGDLSDAHLPDDAATACYNDKLYAVAYPDGDADSCSAVMGNSVCQYATFKKPDGIDDLDGTRWGGVTVEDLVVGSVRTYEQNSNQNGGSVADPSDPGSLEDLMNGDITTPGYMTIPVCNVNVAWDNWVQHGAKPKGVSGWPCSIYPSPNDCQDSSFVDQTSDASPPVDDCMGIVNNIKGTQGEWTIQTAGKSQHKIASYGDCKFGVEARNLHGNVEFHVGAQDIIDIITEAASLYGSGGKLGAEGNVSCWGNVNDQDIKWGIY